MSELGYTLTKKTGIEFFQEFMEQVALLQHIEDELAHDALALEARVAELNERI